MFWKLFCYNNCLMFYKCSPCIWYNPDICWFFSFLTYIYYTLNSPHILSVSTSCSVICKSIHLEITSLQWYHLPIIQAHLPQQLPFSQHTLWQCCNYLDILSSIAEILLFDLVFHDRITSVSVSTLKPPLRVIEAIPLKLRVSPIVGTHI